MNQPTQHVPQHPGTDSAEGDQALQATEALQAPAPAEGPTATQLQYEQHPLSKAFPAMQADEYLLFCDSVQDIGVQIPITLFEGMVIDGWHRYRAATDAGMACPSKELGDVDPQAFVMAQNKVRRHMSQAQVAMATAEVYRWRPHGDQRSTLNVDRTKTTAELADIAGVHANTITQAKAVQSKGALEVQEAVKRGEVGLPKAAAIAKLPLDEQAAALHKPAPKPVKAAVPAAEPEPLDDGPSAEELAANAAAQAADAQTVQMMLDADEPLAAALEENKRLNAEVAQLNQRIHGLMNEKNEAIRLAKSYEHQIDKLKKQLQVPA
jgi:hypothetical protein